MSNMACEIFGHVWKSRLGWGFDFVGGNLLSCKRCGIEQAQYDFTPVDGCRPGPDYEVPGEPGEWRPFPPSPEDYEAYQLERRGCKPPLEESDE